MRNRARFEGGPLDGQVRIVDWDGPALLFPVPSERTLKERMAPWRGISEDDEMPPFASCRPGTYDTARYVRVSTDPMIAYSLVTYRYDKESPQ